MNNRKTDEEKVRGPVEERILVTGPSGSGKTYLASALRCFGVNAVDADTIEGLCRWVDGAGNKVLFPPCADKLFLERHTFLWDRPALADFLSKQRTVYVFGISRNVFEMLDLFDRVFFLKGAPELLLQRLSKSSRVNPMGRTAYQRQYCLEWAAKSEELARSHGVEMIDATIVPEVLLSILLGHGC